MDDQNKDNHDKKTKTKTKRNRPQQLQTHYVPTDEVGNTNCRNQGGDLLFAYKPRTVSRRLFFEE